MTAAARPTLRALPTNETPTFPGYAAKGIRKLADGSLEFGADEHWHFLCSPLRVTALTRNSDGENWGRLVRVLDSDGRELVYCDDAPGAGSDCRFSHTFAAAGAYLIEIRDVNYEGGVEYRYRAIEHA